MNQERVCIRSSHSHPTLEFAERECRAFLDATTALEVTDDAAGADYLFSLSVDRTLRETQYSIRVARGEPTTVHLTGADEACALYALYTFFERLGFYFDVLGPVVPDRVELSDLDTETTTVTPFVKRRGIRQHINFTMDISSYPLAEALEYIRNLARMRMNHMSFHSYNGQWFGFVKDGTYQHGGNFFYGTRLDIPRREPFTRVIRNRSVYSIPEIEAVIDEPERRSRMATEWLTAVMAECRRVGMHVQLSIEPAGETHEEGLAICREVLALYPTIDTLELITPECGDSVRTLNVRELEAFLTEQFGPDVLDSSLLDALKPELAQLEGGLRYCARNLRLIEALRASGDPALPALALGAYITCPDSLRILHSVMQRCAPPDVSLSFLPAHGARRSVHNLGQMGFTSESIHRSMLYSWIEFDGNMYLQQNSVTGTAQLLSFAKETTGPEQVSAVALNHWRTAENRFCIAYAGQAFINGPIDPRLFYSRAAAAFGIADAARFGAAMQELDDLDDLAREKTFNIGFCATVCWIRPGLRWTAKWDDDVINQCRRRFTAVIGELSRCLQSATSPAGREALRFLMNRVRCSIHQLDCAQTMKSLASFCDHEHPDALSAGERQRVSETCDAAMAHADAYLARHAEAIVDRGCEGTLISYQTVMPVYINHIRAVFVEGETECPHLLPQLDEPPPPMVG